MRSDQINSSSFAAAVTPHDTNTINCTRGLYVGGAGDVKVSMADDAKGDATVTFTAVPAGSLLPIQVKRVFSTGTTATAIVALY